MEEAIQIIAGLLKRIEELKQQYIALQKQLDELKKTAN